LNYFKRRFMYSSCLEKQKQMSEIFAKCPTEDAKYQKIIELGRALPPLDEQYKVPENLVKGCQSLMYMKATKQDGHVYFEAQSDALISSGLAAILIKVYSGETPEAILKCPPDFLETLGISASLTPSRANGLYSIHLRMKQDALKFILQSGGPAT
jgi:cysteine desulfuration protein SufE